MRQVMKTIAGLALAMLVTACAVPTMQKAPQQEPAVSTPTVAAPATQPAAPAPAVAASPMAQVAQVATPGHTVCMDARQAGCFDITILNGRFDASHPMMVGLDKPYKSQEERQYRAQFLGPKLMLEVKNGRVHAGAGKEYTIYVWNAHQVSTANFVARRVDDRRLYRTTVQDVTGQVPMPVVEKLGAPTKVYRIRAEGAKPIVASLVVPWSMFTDNSYVLVCTEPSDRSTVYPNRVTALQGHWITPQELAFLKAKGSQGGIMPFLSN